MVYQALICSVAELDLGTRLVPTKHTQCDHMHVNTGIHVLGAIYNYIF